jgi:EAL domain-containing protein (putative c-di-GMP-specific phosphodiesterase class I)
MMDNAMKKFSQLYKDGFNPGILSLNLAIKQLEVTDYIQKLSRAMKKHSFKPQWLKLEILERQVMKKAEENISKLNEIRALGITLAMDDFGTGESSFTYLRKFPISQIKIDKSFVMGMQEENENAEIVKAIIALGNALSLDVIAEGVENEQDKKYLLDNGCHIMQGYHFCKPVKADEFLALFATVF